MKKIINIIVITTLMFGYIQSIQAQSDTSSYVLWGTYTKPATKIQPKERVDETYFEKNPYKPKGKRGANVYPWIKYVNQNLVYDGFWSYEKKYFCMDTSSNRRFCRSDDELSEFTFSREFFKSDEQLIINGDTLIYNGFIRTDNSWILIQPDDIRIEIKISGLKGKRY